MQKAMQAAMKDPQVSCCCAKERAITVFYAQYQDSSLYL